MIKFNNVDFSYGEKKILNNFNLQINQSDRICLFGESGCGKTTVLRLLLGLEKAQNGKIVLPQNSRFSVVFQENRLLPFKTVLENVSLFSKDEETAIFNLKALGLSACINYYPNKLSGGMKRRVAIARALSTDFDCLILDEPFTGLDDNNLEITAKHILSSCENKPILLVSHSKKEAELLNAKIFNM